MNKQSLYTVGGAALLASTALATTSANAAVPIKTFVPASLGLVGATTTFTAPSLATQVFPTTTTTANAVTIQGSTSVGILIDISPTFANFDLKLDIDTSTASFNNTVVPVVTFYHASTTGTLDSAGSVTGCQIQPSTDRISVLGCSTQNSTIGTRVDAILITGLGFTSAAALRTAGTSITVSGSTFLAGTSSTIDSITPTAIVTSKSASGDLTIQAGSTATIDNNSATPFALFVSSGATSTVTTTLGCVRYSVGSTVGTDLANPFASLASVVSSAEVKITHSALTDSSLVSITFDQQTKVSSQFQGSSATFYVTGVSLNGTPIQATFNGTSAISASSGTLSATVSPNAPATMAVAIPSFTGTLATLSRGGLSVELNGVLPSKMQASYISFLRIANQSSVAGAAVITVKSDKDGNAGAVGSFTTASIPAGATLQVNSLDIDAGLTAAGATALTTGTYKVTVTGAFNGYVQNLLYNVASGAFADASGFRNGSLTGDP